MTLGHYCLIVLGTCCGMNLGYPINPARDLGPRIFATFIYGPEVWTMTLTLMPFVPHPRRFNIPPRKSERH
ncbi:hypothetical protein TELCIR_06972 [Teladorsagia circumcincta]|uniref:Aquaporin n=1 Tax=Teladorsagia circumcincta TaxID=45464 RepID=A0A2G9ULW5_TELCI|nr:hypothetical protein TELCIR_06972 [Teladorsagia circumcincta]